MSKKINDQLQKQLNDLYLQFNKTKQSINITIIQIKTQNGPRPAFELKTEQNILDQINICQKEAQDLYSSFNSLTIVDSFYTTITSNFTSSVNSINQEINTKITNVTDIFSNIASQSMLSFKDTIITLKNKTKDFSSNVTQQIQDGVDNLFDTVSNYDKQITDQAEQALQMLSADFGQLNFIDQVKKQMGKQEQILTDDLSDLSLKALNLTNLQDGNLFDFPVKSFISGIQDLISNGTDTIKKTVDSVKNVQNTFNDLSTQLSQIHQVALNFSQFESSFLDINKNFEEIVGQVDLQNLFQAITDDLKQDLTTFVKSQILENLQKLAIDQIRDKLGNDLLKTNLNKAISKLENVNKLFESAITKISSKFQLKNEKKVLFDKNLKFPEQPQPYFIPTPIGVPLVLQYYFQFGAQVYAFIDIQATSVNAGFAISANSDFVASAALSVIIAEIGAYAQGTIIAVDLRMLGWLKRLRNAVSRVGRSISHVGRRFGSFIKKNACIYVPEISKTDKIDILPPLYIKGVETKAQLVNINVG